MIAKVSIYIQNTEMDDILNKESTPRLVDFYFDPGLFAGYWVDKEDNAICFYISNLSFRTPYDIGTLQKFNLYMSNRGVILS